ncbi:hypothetical protein ACHAXT_010877 [Thalassiosira profunda]
MSGGVDSSVAAHLLRRWGSADQKGDDISRENAGGASNGGGVEVVGLHMSNWNALDEDPEESADSSKEGRRRGQKPATAKTNSNNNAKQSRRNAPSNGAFCQASEREYADARSVAAHLGMPLHRASFAAEYWVHVFEPFVAGLAGGGGSVGTGGGNNGNHCEGPTTPNPDFGCNARIKFGAMREHAMEKMGAGWIATGHYARLWHRDGSMWGKGDGNCNPNRSTHDNGFYEWLAETSDALEQRVRESIADRPEEEWLLDTTADAFRNPLLLAGADTSKDQSYFLSGVASEAFRNVLFPLGHLSKSKSTGFDNHQSVRDIAREAGIPTASKRDSMGICFVGKRDFASFVSQYLPEPAQPGNFVDVDTGEIVGAHGGAMRYTIGQGAKISGAKLRYFVCGKRGGDVFVCDDTHHPALYTDELFVDADAFNWIGVGGSDSNCSGGGTPRPLAEGQPLQLWARTRHLQPLAACSVMRTQQNRLAVHFERPMRAVTPGQILALYAGRDGLVCLGGGPIRSRGESLLERGVTDIALSQLHPSGHNDLSLACSS